MSHNKKIPEIVFISIICGAITFLPFLSKMQYKIEYRNFKIKIMFLKILRPPKTESDPTGKKITIQNSI